MTFLINRHEQITEALLGISTGDWCTAVIPVRSNADTSPLGDKSHYSRSYCISLNFIDPNLEN